MQGAESLTPVLPVFANALGSGVRLERLDGCGQRFLLGLACILPLGGHRDNVGRRISGRRGARIAALTSGGAIPEVGDYRVIADPDETFVGTLNEDFAIESMAGDVFLLGAIGAFFGWKAVLFNIVASSFAGSIIGVGLIALGKHELGRHIPFGPYMALGVIAWMFGGDALIDWYLTLFAEPLPVR